MRRFPPDLFEGLSDDTGLSVDVSAVELLGRNCRDLLGGSPSKPIAVFIGEDSSGEVNLAAPAHPFMLLKDTHSCTQGSTARSNDGDGF